MITYENGEKPYAASMILFPKNADYSSGPNSLLQKICGSDEVSSGVNLSIE
jgi:hypothetical protein